MTATELRTALDPYHGADPRRPYPSMASELYRRLYPRPRFRLVAGNGTLTLTVNYGSEAAA